MAATALTTTPRAWPWASKSPAALSGADVTTDKSVRFCFWDKEELGLYGAYGYVQDRRGAAGHDQRADVARASFSTT